jgi:hypothetical protein
MHCSVVIQNKRIPLHCWGHMCNWQCVACCYTIMVIDVNQSTQMLACISIVKKTLAAGVPVVGWIWSSLLIVEVAVDVPVPLAELLQMVANEGSSVVVPFVDCALSPWMSGCMVMGGIVDPFTMPLCACSLAPVLLSMSVRVGVGSFHHVCRMARRCLVCGHSSAVDDVRIFVFFFFVSCSVLCIPSMILQDSSDGRFLDRCCCFWFVQENLHISLACIRSVV